MRGPGRRRSGPAENPTPAIAKTGRRSEAKISRRSWADSTTSRITAYCILRSPEGLYCGLLAMKTVDVGAVLDEGRWTGYQKLLIFGTALTIILDGVDNQLLPNAHPDADARNGRCRARASRTRWRSGPFGMMIGGAARRHARRSHRAPHGAARQRAGVRRPDARDRLRRTTSSCSGCCGSSPASASAARCPTPRRSRPNTCRAVSGRSRSR